MREESIVRQACRRQNLKDREREGRMGFRKKRIGFVVGNYHTDHPSRLVSMIWELLRDKDVELQVFLGTESASFMKEFAMRSNRFDYQYASLCGYTGYEELDVLIISAGTLSIYQNEIPLEEFLQNTADIPKILLETDYKDENCICLIADNTQGLASCVEHLITVHGMTRIGYLGGPKNNIDAQERFAGYKNMLLKHGIAFRKEYVAPGDYSENVDQSVEALLDRAPELEAIVSANDEMTVAIYRVCQKRGLKVGKDIAVTGFDDMKMARYMAPPLTTSRQDYDAISRMAVDYAMKLIEGETPVSARVAAPFIRRCSCGCSPKEAGQEAGGPPERAELLRNLERSREYQHNSWIGSLMNREMLLAADEPKRFFETIGNVMNYLGAASSYLCLFEHPLIVKEGTIPDFPDKILVCMRQTGGEYAGYDWDEAPVMYRDLHNDMGEFRADGSYMTFLLFDEKYQYGVLNAAIEPDMIDLFYVLSLDIGTNLRYMEIWLQQKQYRAELQAMAQTDALTGLQNRAGVIEARQTMIGRRSRMGGVIMADLDHLKQINDQFGHHEGDFALKAVADILRQAICAEEGETGADSRQKPLQVLGRIGGDEFICCSVGMTQEDMKEQIRRARELCSQFNERSGKPYYVEISAGIATGRVRNIEDWTKLSNRADEELYEAKKTRREFVIR